MAPLTWTLSERMTPSCGISTVASRSASRWAGIPSRSLRTYCEKPYSAAADQCRDHPVVFVGVNAVIWRDDHGSHSTPCTEYNER